ncbi:hypothetical protein ABMA28_009384 [Loxostege sticticalis]|uniref:ISXO2-like transposase domain-containing protein n=1 Tax=Loxostege sticticalis TaxID=481309 RepID=A0ABD0SE10_LOXSC
MEPVVGSSSAEPMPGCSWEQPQPSGSSTEEQCIRFSEERGLLPTEKMCTYHKKPMTLSNKGQVGQFRCRKGKCRNKSYSRAAGTWFKNARLPLPFMFQIMYMFSVDYTYEAVRRETSDMREEVLSQATIADWFNYCREAIIVYQMEHEESREKIGGPGKIFQIEETKFERRKYSRDGSDDLRLEVCPDNQRNADVLVQLIKKHVREGSTIHTDFWKAYDCLPEHGYIHKEVNHSDPINKFVAPDGVHTQRIESHWRVMKRLFSKDNYKSNFTEWLIEHIWRINNRINHRDQFEELLKCIVYVYKIDFL